MADRKKVLITGAGGYIGSFLRRAWNDKYDLVINDRREIKDPGDAEVIMGDIRDVDLMRRACQGVDTVVHLAADPSPAGDFDEDVLPMNIIGTHNVFRAAAEAGVKRVIFASSVHCVGGYPPDVQVKWDMPVRPCCEYGASKCYGESLGRYFADKHNISVIAIRIGGVHGHQDGDTHHAPNRLGIMVSEDDLTQLITKCIEAPDDIQFAITHGVSNNRIKYLDLSHTRELLGYEPEDEVGEDMEIPEQDPVHP